MLQQASPLTTTAQLLVSQILQQIHPMIQDQNESAEVGQVAHVGYTDIIGQLRGALDQFSGVTLFAFSWVAVLLGVYVLLIGPGDYFFLNRVLGRHGQASFRPGNLDPWQDFQLRQSARQTTGAVVEGVEEVSKLIKEIN